MRYTSFPSAGSVKGSGIVTTRSGFPSCQSSLHTGFTFRSAAAPSGAPAFHQRSMVAICPSVSRRSPSNSTTPCSGSHGGMIRAAVTFAIVFACFRASAYPVSANGPIPPG